MNSHKRRVHKGETYHCQKCDKIYSYSATLYTHVKAAHANIRYQCKVCDFQASSINNINTHEKAVYEGLKHIVMFVTMHHQVNIT